MTLLQRVEKFMIRIMPFRKMFYTKCKYIVFVIILNLYTRSRASKEIQLNYLFFYKSLIYKGVAIYNTLYRYRRGHYIEKNFTIIRIRNHKSIGEIFALLKLITFNGSLRNMDNEVKRLNGST